MVTGSYVFKTHVACNVAHHGLVVRKDVRVHKGNRQVANASLQQRQQRIAHPTEHVSRAQSMWYLSVGRAIHTTETTPAARACVRIRVGRRLDDQSLARAANHAPSIAVQRAPAVIAHHPLTNLHDRLVPISQGQETEGNRNETRSNPPFGTRITQCDHVTPRVPHRADGRSILRSKMLGRDCRGGGGLRWGAEGYDRC